MAVQDQATLLADIANKIPDNEDGEVDPSDVRTPMQNLVDTLFNLAASKADTSAVAPKVHRVVHGATAETARPAGVTYVEWVGSVAPTNAQDNDTWVDTSV